MGNDPAGLGNAAPVSKGSAWWPYELTFDVVCWTKVRWFGDIFGNSKISAILLSTLQTIFSAFCDPLAVKSLLQCPQGCPRLLRDSSLWGKCLGTWCWVNLQCTCKGRKIQNPNGRFWSMPSTSSLPSMRPRRTFPVFFLSSCWSWLYSFRKGSWRLRSCTWVNAVASNWKPSSMMEPLCPISVASFRWSLLAIARVQGSQELNLSPFHILFDKEITKFPIFVLRCISRTLELIH